MRFDPSTGSVRARRVRRLGKLVLADEPVQDVDPAAVAAALLDGVRASGLDALPWTPAAAPAPRARRLPARGARARPGPTCPTRRCAQRWTSGWPRCCPAGARSTTSAPTTLDAALKTLLPWELQRRLDAEAPTHSTAPTGSRLPIDYAAEGGPRVEVRVQELFGLATHPTIAGGRVTLTLALLSPAHRPVQVTRDLPGFWNGSYKAVRTEMRGRYPRHPWPEDPRAAPPTRAPSRGGRSGKDASPLSPKQLARHVCHALAYAPLIWRSACSIAPARWHASASLLHACLHFTYLPLAGEVGRQRRACPGDSRVSPFRCFIRSGPFVPPPLRPFLGEGRVRGRSRAHRCLPS